MSPLQFSSSPPTKSIKCSNSTIWIKWILSNLVKLVVYLRCLTEGQENITVHVPFKIQQAALLKFFSSVVLKPKCIHTEPPRWFAVRIFCSSQQRVHRTASFTERTAEHAAGQTYSAVTKGQVGQQVTREGPKWR